jgi:hypothetical protein
MYNYTLPEAILYDTENRSELASLAIQLFDEYQPCNADEGEIFDRILAAAWLRKRYEKVRSKLYDRKHTLEADSPQVPILMDSIRRFQHEVEQQKKIVTSLRKTLRKSREAEQSAVEEPLHEYLSAA